MYYLCIWAVKALTSLCIPTVYVSGALAPLFGNGAGAYGIGKISSILTKIGKIDIVFMYDVSIARLISIIKLTLVYYEKRERKKQVWLYSVKLQICNNMFCICIIWNKDGEQKKFGGFWEFLSGIGKKTSFLALGMGPNFSPKIGWSRALCHNVLYAQTFLSLPCSLMH